MCLLRIPARFSSLASVVNSLSRHQLRYAVLCLAVLLSVSTVIGGAEAVTATLNDVGASESQLLEAIKSVKDKGELQSLQWELIANRVRDVAIARKIVEHFRSVVSDGDAAFSAELIGDLSPASQDGLRQLNAVSTDPIMLQHTIPKEVASIQVDVNGLTGAEKSEKLLSAARQFFASSDVQRFLPANFPANGVSRTNVLLRINDREYPVELRKLSDGSFEPRILTENYTPSVPDSEPSLRQILKEDYGIELRKVRESRWSDQELWEIKLALDAMTDEERKLVRGIRLVRQKTLGSTGHAFGVYTDGPPRRIQFSDRAFQVAGFVGDASGIIPFGAAICLHEIGHAIDYTAVPQDQQAALQAAREELELYRKRAEGIQQVAAERFRLLRETSQMLNDASSESSEQLKDSKTNADKGDRLRWQLTQKLGDAISRVANVAYKTYLLKVRHDRGDFDYISETREIDASYTSDIERLTSPMPEALHLLAGEAKEMLNCCEEALQAKRQYLEAKADYIGRLWSLLYSYGVERDLVSRNVPLNLTDYARFNSQNGDPGELFAEAYLYARAQPSLLEEHLPRLFVLFSGHNYRELSRSSQNEDNDNGEPDGEGDDGLGTQDTGDQGRVNSTANFTGFSPYDNMLQQEFYGDLPTEQQYRDARKALQAVDNTSVQATAAASSANEPGASLSNNPVRKRRTATKQPSTRKKP